MLQENKTLFCSVTHPIQSPMQGRPRTIHMELLPILEIPPFKWVPKWCFGTGGCVCACMRVCVGGQVDEWCEKSSANLFGPHQGNEWDVRSALLIFIGFLHSEGVSPQNASETNFAPVYHRYNYWFFSKVSISFPPLLIWGALLWSYRPQGLAHIMFNTFHHLSYRKCFPIVFASVVFS